MIFLFQQARSSLSTSVNLPFNNFSFGLPVADLRSTRCMVMTRMSNTILRRRASDLLLRQVHIPRMTVPIQTAPRSYPKTQRRRRLPVIGRSRLRSALASLLPWESQPRRMFTADHESRRDNSGCFFSSPMPFSLFATIPSLFRLLVPIS